MPLQNLNIELIISSFKIVTFDTYTFIQNVISPTDLTSCPCTGTYTMLGIRVSLNKYFMIGWVHELGSDKKTNKRFTAFPLRTPF